MKKSQALLLGIGTILVIILVAYDIQNNGNKHLKQDRLKTDRIKTNKNDIQKNIENSNALWYATEGINKKSEIGMEAFYFKKNTKQVNIYNITKYYKSYKLAKDVNALHIEGTVHYTFNHTTNNQTIIKFTGKLSGIPMTQTMTFKNTIMGTNNATKISLNGYKVIRSVDDDKTNNIFVQAVK